MWLLILANKKKMMGTNPGWYSMCLIEWTFITTNVRMVSCGMKKIFLDIKKIRLFYSLPLPREKCQSDACGARPCVISNRTSKKLTRIINSVTSLLFLYSPPSPGFARTRWLHFANEFLLRNRPRGRIPSSTRRGAAGMETKRRLLHTETVSTTHANRKI